MSTNLERKPREIYGDQLLFLLVLLGMGAVMSGTRSLLIAGFAVLTSIIVDLLCCYFSKKTYNPRDLSTITSGLCLALMSPASLSFSIIIFGSFLAIGVKHIFGGKDNYIFNPTAVAFAFLIICYPLDMLLFPAVDEILPAFGEVPIPTAAGIENFLLRRGEFPALSPLELLLGSFPGPIGTTHVLIIIISAICLLFRRSVSFVVTISCLSVITISRILFPIYDDIIGALVRELLGGYLLFALLFLANDPQTLPKTVFGKLYYGVLLGVLTIVFRGSADGIFRGRVEGWFIFALLIANTLSCRMDLLSAKVSRSCSHIASSMKKKLSAFEHFSEDAKSGKSFTGDITATMEIDLDLSNYHMPAVDNKVIKIKRKKRNVLTALVEFFGSLKEKAKRRKEDELKIPYGDINDHKPSFVAESFKELFDTVKTPFEKKELSEIAPMIDKEKIFTEEEPEADKSNIDIADFAEISKTVAKIEAKVEAEIKAREEEEAEKARIAAELAAKIAAEEAEKARIEAEKAEAKAKAEAEKAEAKAKAEIERAEAKAKAEIEKAEARAKKAEEKARIDAEKAKAKEEAEAEKARLEAEKARLEAEKEAKKAAEAANVGADDPVRPQEEPAEIIGTTESSSPTSHNFIETETTENSEDML
jgi:electron transport complex protein RnfD